MYDNHHYDAAKHMLSRSIPEVAETEAVLALAYEQNRTAEAINLQNQIAFLNWTDTHNAPVSLDTYRNVQENVIDKMKRLLP